MNHSYKNKRLRLLLAVMIVLTAAALATLAWVLVSQTSAAPAPVATPSPTLEPTPAPTATPEPTPSPPPEPTPVPVELGPTGTGDAGQEYIDKIVFLGDSSIYWLAGLNMLPFTQVWTDSIGTMSLFNVPSDPIAYYDPANPTVAESLLIPECAARRQPEILIITLGLNGIAMLNEEQFKGYYTDMLAAIQQASPNTKIILQSILPVMDSRVPKGISNEKINTANQWVYAIAEQMGVRYLNSHDVLMDETGNLRTDYNNDLAMGIHMNTTGFVALLQNIPTHAWQ